MDEQPILTTLALGEEVDWEFKSAKGGLPGSLWETYSAMANTDGGTIVLGVEERGGGFVVSGLDDPAKTKQDFWNTVNNRGKVSINLLADELVGVKDVGGKLVLVIHVPRAERRQRPVYVGQNPLTGTYRRNFEGDYKCRPEEVGRMLADQSEESLDGRVLERFGTADLDPVSLKQYRQRFASRLPDHPWVGLGDQEFLDKIGAWRTERRSGLTGLTVAGLLMFGKDEAIRDPEAVPEFNLDYRERLSDDPKVRWTDRLTFDGTWVCNIFQFYHRVIQRLFADLKVPFELDSALMRKGETPVHEAIREVLVNSLIHADYRGQGGIVIEKYRDRLEFSNPGTLLLGLDQILQGGVSECRNKLLQKVFSFLGYGERAGSGYDRIRQGWASQQWRLPSIEETARPDRVRVSLPMVSLLPEDSLERLRKGFGSKWRGLGPVEVQALVTADVEGRVTNARMRQASAEHPADVTKLLQSLVSKGLLDQRGQKRGTYYCLPAGIGVGAQGPLRRESDSLRKDQDSLRKESDSLRKDQDSTHKPDTGAEELDAQLVAVAQPARDRKRLPVKECQEIILKLCRDHYLSLARIAELIQRDAVGVANRLVGPLVKAKKLTMRYPEEPNRPDQAYTTTKQGDTK